MSTSDSANHLPDPTLGSAPPSRSFDATIGPTSSGGSTSSHSNSDLSNEDCQKSGSFGSTQSQSSFKRKRVKTKNSQAQKHRYQTTKTLGQGGWGVVEQAVDRQLQRPVAIKRLLAESPNPRLREEFLHEAKVTSQLQHPGIVPVHELVNGQAGDDLYYVMKLLQGKSLRDRLRETHHRLRQNPKQDFREAIIPLLERFAHVCDAIAYAHAEGVIHRDLKPDNIMLGQFGETNVVDWGLAAYVVAPASSEDATFNASANESPSSCRATTPQAAVGSQSNTAIGTPAYMSPEQAIGNVDGIGTPSDIYSLGATLYEIVAGQHPFKGLSTNDVLDRVKAGNWCSARQTNPHVPKALSAICDKAMALRPEDRYHCARELGSDIRNFIAGEAVSCVPETFADHALRWCRKHRGMAITIALSTVGILLLTLSAAYLIRVAHLNEIAAHQETLDAYAVSLERTEQSRKAADTWLIDLSGSLEFYPGMQPLRDDLIEKAIRHYNSLLVSIPNENQLPGSSPNGGQILAHQFSLERALQLLRLGDLHRLKGDFARAQENYEAASESLKQIENSGLPTKKLSETVKLQQVNVSIGLCLVGLEHPLSSDLDHWLDETLTRIRQRLPSNESPDDTPALSTFERDVISARARLGLSRLRGHYDGDRLTRSKEAQATVDWAKILNDQKATDASFQLLETALVQQAHEWEDQQDWDHAANCWRMVVDVHAAQQSQDGKRIDRLQSQAYARLHLAKTLGKANHPGTRRQQAIAQLEAADQEFKQAWRQSDANGFYQRNLASIQHNLGKLLAGDTKRRADAQQHFENSVVIRKQLIRQQPAIEDIRAMCESIDAWLQATGESVPDQTDLLDAGDVGYQLIQEHCRLTPDEKRAWSQLLTVRSRFHKAKGNTESAIGDRLMSERLQGQ